MGCRVCDSLRDVKFRNGTFSCQECNLFFLRYSEDCSQIQPCISYSFQCYNILTINSRACQFCRLYKCIEVGMSREGVQFDRVKALVMNAFKNISSIAQNTVPTMINLIHKANVRAFNLTRSMISTMSRKPDNSFHDKSSDFVCPLNLSWNTLPGENKGEKRYASCHENVAEFAGGIPGFSLLSPDDQRTLIEPGYFQLLFVMLLPLFGTSSLRCPNDQIIHRDRLPVGSKGELMNLLFTSAGEINKYELSKKEIGIFSSYILMNPDRPGLKDKYTVSFMRNRLKNVLCNIIPKHIDINDLTRISNYLDVAYKTHEFCSDINKIFRIISKLFLQGLLVNSTEETVHSSAEASTSTVQ